VPTLPRRTATTRLSPKAARHRRRQGVANIRSGGLSPRKQSPDGATAHIRLTGLLLIYRPRKDERLSWPSWLTCSWRFTHIVVTRRLQAERRTGSVHRPKTSVPPTVLHCSTACYGLQMPKNQQSLIADFHTFLRDRLLFICYSCFSVPYFIIHLCHVSKLWCNRRCTVHYSFIMFCDLTSFLTKFLCNCRSFLLSL